MTRLIDRHPVRPDMRYCFRSGRCRPNPRTKHISVPPRHMTITALQIQGTTFHTIGIQVREYITTAEGTCLSTDYKQMPNGKGKTHHAHVTARVQALRRGPLASRRRVFEGIQEKDRRAPLRSKVV